MSREIKFSCASNRAHARTIPRRGRRRDTDGPRALPENYAPCRRITRRGRGTRGRSAAERTMIGNANDMHNDEGSLCAIRLGNLTVKQRELVLVVCDQQRLDDNRREVSLLPKALLDRVRTLFDRMDRGREKYLTRNDFVSANSNEATTRGLYLFENLLNVMDEDSNGQISEAEFLHYFVISALYGGYNQIVHAVPSHTVNTNERSLTTLGDQILKLNETFVERFDVTLSKFEDVCLMLLQ